MSECLSPNCRVSEGVCFSNPLKLEDLAGARLHIDELASQGSIRCLVLLLDQPGLAAGSAETKPAVFEWLTNFQLPTIAYVDGVCTGEQFELALMSDIRLGGLNLTLQYRASDSATAGYFDFAHRCRLLLGSQTGLDYPAALATGLTGQAALELRLVNQLIAGDDRETAIRAYLNRILGDKELYQIKSIMRCFNHYKAIPGYFERALLLEQETLQFCYLMRKLDEKIIDRGE